MRTGCDRSAWKKVECLTQSLVLSAAPHCVGDCNRYLCEQHTESLVITSPNLSSNAPQPPTALQNVLRRHERGI
ncbi:hypothetical protein EON66_01325 [archaeon]|nr:MAG: hypothetical protein EON66_01325 [archaeon]